MLKSIIKIIGVFLVVYSITEIPLYTSYYYSTGDLNAFNFISVVAVPFLLSVAIGVLCIVNAGKISRWVSGGGPESSVDKSDFDVAFRKNAVRLLCIYLLFIAVSDLAYGVGYFLAVQKMVGEPDYVDPEGVSKIISAVVELVAVAIIYKARWFRE